MTATEMNPLLGAQVYLEPVRGLLVSCIVTNVKTAYGHQRVEITPQAGRGRCWVAAGSVTPAPQGPKPEGAQHGRS